MATSETSPALRLTALTAIIAVLFVGLIARLWFLQVLAGDRYEAIAETNAVRSVLIDAPRGRILDRSGEEIVKNRVAHTISADRNQLLDGNGDPKDETAERVLERLSTLLDIPREQIVERLTSPRYSRLRPIPIMVDVAPEIVFAVSEHAELFPGVVADRIPVREYPQGELASHVLGYVREIDENKLESPDFAGYRPGDVVGYDGLELAYEHDLQGTAGLSHYEVNARGTVLRELGGSDPVPGDDLVTTLDAELQADVERILEEGILASRNEIHTSSGRPLASPAGAAVVLDPRDGAVRAMASYPDYDPRQFVGSLSPEYADYLYPSGEDAVSPAINRAITAAHPPGSVWKIVSGMAALRAGQITPQSAIGCPGSYRVGSSTFRNWNPRNEGAMDLSTALMRSCDTFFYDLAYNRWLTEERLDDEGQPYDEIYSQTAHDFGFGQPTGIEIVGEKGGTVPDRSWKREQWEQNKDRWCEQAELYEPGSYFNRLLSENCNEGHVWRGGDAVNASIGQGYITTTPLQVATAYMAVANRGTVYQPRLGEEVIDAVTGERRPIEPTVARTIDAPAEWWDELQLGLQNVVMADRGTARGAFSGFPLETLPVAGKTGTAEAGDDIPFAWFASYAPAHDPQYVVVVMVEQGGGGSQTAAPIARGIYEAILDQPVSPFEAGPGNVD